MGSQVSLDILGSPYLYSYADMTGPNADCVRHAPFVFPPCNIRVLVFFFLDRGHQWIIPDDFPS